MSINKYLDLSTGHLPEKEMQALDAQSQDSLLCGCRVIKHNYGVWVHVPYGDDPDDHVLEVERSQIFPRQIVCKARHNGAKWINFDSDGDIDPGLPQFDW